MDSTRDGQLCGTPKEACLSTGQCWATPRSLLPVLLLLRPYISYALLLYEVWSQPDCPSLISRLTFSLFCYRVSNRTLRVVADNRS